MARDKKLIAHIGLERWQLFRSQALERGKTEHELATEIIGQWLNEELDNE